MTTTTATTPMTVDELTRHCERAAGSTHRRMVDHIFFAVEYGCPNAIAKLGLSADDRKRLDALLAA